MAHKPKEGEIFAYIQRNCPPMSYRRAARELSVDENKVRSIAAKLRKKKRKEIEKAYNPDTSGKWIDSYVESFSDWVAPVNEDLMAMALRDAWSYVQKLK